MKNTLLSRKARRILYQNPWIRLIQDDVQRGSGQPFQYTFVEGNDFVIVVPVLDDGRLLMVRQHRYPINAFTWEFPAGNIDEQEMPIDAATRELAEETGKQPQNITYLGEMRELIGFTKQHGHVFAATGLTEADIAVADDEIASSMAFSVQELQTKIKEGRINDALTTAVLYRYLLLSE